MLNRFCCLPGRLAFRGLACPAFLLLPPVFLYEDQLAQKPQLVCKVTTFFGKFQT